MKRMESKKSKPSSSKDGKKGDVLADLKAKMTYFKSVAEEDIPRDIKEAFIKETQKEIDAVERKQRKGLSTKNILHRLDTQATGVTEIVELLGLLDRKFMHGKRYRKYMGRRKHTKKYGVSSVQRTLIKLKRHPSIKVQNMVRTMVRKWAVSEPFEGLGYETKWEGAQLRKHDIPELLKKWIYETDNNDFLARVRKKPKRVEQLVDTIIGKIKKREEKKYPSPKKRQAYYRTLLGNLRNHRRHPFLRTVVAETGDRGIRTVVDKIVKNKWK